MSNYKFAPCPKFAKTNDGYVFWDSGFSDEEIQRINDLGESKVVNKATVGGISEDKDISNTRISKVTWIDLDASSEWLYDRLAYITRQLNGEYYNFDLYGFWEHMQFTIYDGSSNGHYEWHIDAGIEDECPRKMSLVLQLSDPSEYEGGELQIMTSKTPVSVDKKKGLVVAFPSYQLHRVTPVTSGVRKTLVVWVTGPSFK